MSFRTIRIAGPKQLCHFPAAIYVEKFSDNEDKFAHAYSRDYRTRRQIAYGGSEEGKMELGYREEIGSTLASVRLIF